MPKAPETEGTAPRLSVAGKGVYDARHAGWLVNPLRSLIMPAQRIVGRLGLKPSDHVLEIGPGPGWFSPTVAQALPEGRLVLFDIQRAMLDLAGQRLRAAGCANFDLIEGDAARLPFPDAAFDVVFLVTVLGEIGEPDPAVREIERVLKPGGRLSITEQLGDPDYIPFRRLQHLAAGVGLALERRFGSVFIYTANFRKP